jgi:hypothetical protein
MSFKKKWFSNTYVNSDGYEITFRPRAGIDYRDGQHLININSEMLTNLGVALYSDDMRVGSDNGPQLQDNNLRLLIVHRIKALCDHLGWPLDIS